MSCCGQKREALRRTISLTKDAPGRQPAPTGHRPHYLFRYEGQAATVRRGVVTGKNYRFNFNGEICMVDDRDADAFMAEPLFKQIILP